MRHRVAPRGRATRRLVSPQLATHSPCLQVWLALHCLPQRPQLRSSVLRLTHLPAQLVRRPVGQHFPTGRPVHVPLQAAQIVPSGHWLPHVPQCCSLVLGLMQLPAQQVCPLVQVVPQVPQLLLSVWVLRQVPPQHLLPVPQPVLFCLFRV